MDLTAMKNRAASFWPSARAPGGRPSDGSAGFDVQQWLAPVEKLVRERPAISLAAAFAIGVTIAWFVKRK
jgi:hypothetical protein